MMALVRWLRILYHEHGVKLIDEHIASEERRQQTHDERMRAWRAYRAEEQSKVDKLLRKPGSVIWSLVVKHRNPGRVGQ